MIAFFNYFDQIITGVAKKLVYIFNKNNPPILPIFPDEENKRIISQIEENIKNELELEKKRKIEQANTFMNELKELKELTMDLAEREKELRESKIRFDDIAFLTKDWLWELDTDYKFVYSNDGIKNILGLKPVDIIGKTFKDIIYGLDKDSKYHELMSLFESKEFFKDFVIRLNKYCGDDVLSWGNITAIPIRSGNEILGYRGACGDVSIVKRWGLLLETVLDDQDEMIIRFYSNKKINYVNKTFYTFLGKGDRKEVIGKYVNDVFENDKYFQELFKMLGTITRQNQKIDFVLEYNPQNVNKILHHICTGFFNGESEPYEFQIIIRDITNTIKDKEKLVLNDLMIDGICENTNVAVWVKDAVGRFIFASDSFIKNFFKCLGDYSINDINGKSSKDILNNIGLNSCNLVLDTEMRNKYSKERKEQLMFIQYISNCPVELCENRIFEIVERPIFNKDEYIGSIGIILNITEYKEKIESILSEYEKYNIEKLSNTLYLLNDKINLY